MKSTLNVTPHNDLMTFNILSRLCSIADSYATPLLELDTEQIRYKNGKTEKQF